MTVLRGDILDIQSGIIAHQVNCDGHAGAGLAKQMRERIPDWYDDYKLHLSYLGDCRLFAVTPHLFIANLFGQLHVGHGLQTNYDGLRRSMQELSRMTREPDYTIFMPWGIGCGLGGGDWPTVLGIIEQELPRTILIKL